MRIIKVKSHANTALCLCIMTAINSGLETNAGPLARGELNSVRASGSSDLTSPVGEWEFYGDLSTISDYRDRKPSTNFKWIKSSK